MRLLRRLSLPVIIERLNDSYWILPTAVTLVIVGLLALLLNPEVHILGNEVAKKVLSGYSPDAARMILSSISTSVMTVIGVLFSITIVVIQQASNQYSPRIIEIFIKARNGQLVLGLYVGTFVYCILLLRQIPTDVNAKTVIIPQAAVSGAVVLALICIGFLVQYVHFIGHSIKSSRIIQEILQDGLAYLKRYQDFRDSYGTEAAAHREIKHEYDLCVRESGYFQSYNPSKIDNVLRGLDAQVRISREAGDYFHEGDIIGVIRSARPVSDRQMRKLEKALQFGPERTHSQDVRYSLRQLADITMRALSPAMNDSSTAIEALNATGVLIEQWQRAPACSDVMCLPYGTRLHIANVTLEEILEISFRELATCGQDHYIVLAEAIRILERITETTNNERSKEVTALYLSLFRELHQKADVFSSQASSSNLGGSFMSSASTSLGSRPS